MKALRYLMLLFLFIRSVIASSQTCDSMAVCDCTTKDLSPSDVMFGHEHGKGKWKISYRYMSMMMEGKLKGSNTVDDNFVFNNYIMSPQRMQMDMHMLMGMYGFTNKFSVMVMMNYASIKMDMLGLAGTTMQMDGRTMVMTANSTNMSSKSSGLGDTKLYGVYALINHTIHHFFLSAGISIPTGSIMMKGSANDIMYANVRYPYMMQLGSGSVDFMPAVTYLLKKNKTSASVEIGSVVRPFNNSLNYHLGNEYKCTIWLAHKWFPWVSSSLRVEANSVESITGKDESLYETIEPSAFNNNYGGRNLNGFVGINFYVNKSFLKNNKFSVEYGLPVYQNVNGVQLDEKSAVYAGWLISF